MRTMLVRLLTVLLVPAVWLSTSEAAEAATTYSPTTSASFTFDSWVPGVYGECGIAAYYAVDATVAVKASVACQFGWAMNDNAWYYTRTVTLSLRGEGCVAVPAMTFPDLQNGGASVSATTTVGSGCVVDEACWSINVERDFTADFNASGCVPLPMGVPPAAVPGNETPCPAFDPIAAPKFLTKTGPVSGGSPSTYAYRHTYEFKTNLKGVAAGSYLVYFIYGPTGTSTISGRVGPFMSVTRPQLIGPHTFQAYADIKDAQVIQGVGLVSSGYGPTAYYSDTVFWDGTTGALGANDPPSCRFYWGLKAVNLAGTTTDEPMGPVDGSAIGGTPAPEPSATPPLPPDSSTGCTFSWSDPTSWASAGMCALIEIMGRVMGLLGSILTTLGGLVVDLVASLGDLAQTLFVPDPSSWGFDGLLDQFQTRPPGSVVMGIGDGLGSFRDAYSGSGCGLLADFSSDDIDGSLTCSNVKSVPGYGGLYALVQIGMFALTGLGVFRMLAGKVGGDT